MTKSASKWWIGGAIVVVLIALITWAGVREDQLGLGVTGTQVDVLSTPQSGRTGVPVFFRWELRAPVGVIATHTAIHWGTESRQLTRSETPAEAGYPNLLQDYAAGSYALPRNFSGAVTFPSAGTYYYRAHAMISGSHYWSPEQTIVVE